MHQEPTTGGKTSMLFFSGRNVYRSRREMLDWKELLLISQVGTEMLEIIPIIQSVLVSSMHARGTTTYVSPIKDNN